jgi:hypothetical protein
VSIDWAFDVELPEFDVVVEPDPVTSVTVTEASVAVIAVGGEPGPPGPGSPFLILTQAEYDALSPPDPGTVYVIV